MRNLICILLIFYSSVISFGKDSEKFITKDSKEAFFYIEKLEKYYPLLWKNDNIKLKKISITEKTREDKDLYSFKIGKIKTNGYISTLVSEAKRQGLFLLLDQAYNAPQKSIVDIGLSGKSSVKFRTQLACVLLKLRVVFYFKILRFAQNNKWKAVINSLKVWENVYSVISHNSTYNYSINRLLKHLINNYEIPDKEKTTIMMLEKRTRPKVKTVIDK